MSTGVSMDVGGTTMCLYLNSAQAVISIDDAYDLAHQLSFALEAHRVDLINAQRRAQINTVYFGTCEVQS